jgi:hypothetical protein
MVHDYSTHGTTPKNSHVGSGFSRDTLLILYVKNTSSLPFYFVKRVAAEETVSKLWIWWFELLAGPKARHRIGPTVRSGEAKTKNEAPKVRHKADDT